MRWSSAVKPGPGERSGSGHPRTRPVAQPSVSDQTRLNAWTIEIIQSIWKNDLRRESIRRGAGFVDVEDAVLVDTREPAEGKIFF
jgi:hypothetical protein